MRAYRDVGEAAADLEGGAIQRELIAAIAARGRGRDAARAAEATGIGAEGIGRNSRRGADRDGRRRAQAVVPIARDHVMRAYRDVGEAAADLERSAERRVGKDGIAACGRGRYAARAAEANGIGA